MEVLQARMIIEIMGRPPQHVTETMKMLVDRLEKERGVKLIEVKLHDPIEVKDVKDLYTSFVEIELEFESVGAYLGIIFAYLPSNVEIISPAKISVPTESLNVLGNNLIARMHSYDAIAKKMMADKEVLMRQVAFLEGKNKGEIKTVAEEHKKKKSKDKKSSKK